MTFSTHVGGDKSLNETIPALGLLAFNLFLLFQCYFTKDKRSSSESALTLDFPYCTLGKEIIKQIEGRESGLHAAHLPPYDERVECTDGLAGTAAKAYKWLSKVKCVLCSLCRFIVNCPRHPAYHSQLGNCNKLKVGN